ncbi:hypothetical protein GP486_007998, partial [Trichoglossum hirsutum]
IVRATTPIFTVLIYRLGYARTYSTPTYLSLIPTIAGVAFATYGDYYFTPLGFLLTALGALLAAVKTVTANRIQTGRLRLGALDILYRMSPLALVQAVGYAYLSGEVGALRRHAVVLRGEVTAAEASGLLANAVIAFALNVASFTANKTAGGLTMSVAAVLKQILTIILGILLFRVKIGPLNAFGEFLLLLIPPSPFLYPNHSPHPGIILTLLGTAWYGKVELDSKQRSSISTSSSSSLKQPKSHLPLQNPPQPPLTPGVESAKGPAWRLV